MKFSRLEVLVVDMLNWEHGGWCRKEELKFVPVCVSSHLTSVHIIGYKGSTSDLEFAKYLLKNAKVLKTLTICMFAHDSNNQRIKELSAIPRGKCRKMRPL